MVAKTGSELEIVLTQDPDEGERYGISTEAFNARMDRKRYQVIWDPDMTLRPGAKFDREDCPADYPKTGQVAPGWLSVGTVAQNRITGTKWYIRAAVIINSETRSGRWVQIGPLAVGDLVVVKADHYDKIGRITLEKGTLGSVEEISGERVCLYVDQPGRLVVVGREDIEVQDQVREAPITSLDRVGWIDVADKVECVKDFGVRINETGRWDWGVNRRGTVVEATRRKGFANRYMVEPDAPNTGRFEFKRSQLGVIHPEGE